MFGALGLANTILQGGTDWLKMRGRPSVMDMDEKSINFLEQLSLRIEKCGKPACQDPSLCRLRYGTHSINRRFGRT